MYQNLFKRIIDFVLALAGLIILSPLFLFIVLIIKLDSKGPVFFKQKRIGKRKKFFFIYKFRTMVINTPNDAPTHLLKNPDSFITKSGRFLRKTSLDELPQIINILKGEMSIVGPRPALWNQYDLIDERDKYQVNKLSPGLTGWAQVNGRDELPIKIKAELDGYYKENLSFTLDLKCFIKTIFSVVKSEGVVEGETKKNYSEKQSQSNKNLN